jgi:hypothetical protein
MNEVKFDFTAGNRIEHLLGVSPQRAEEVQELVGNSIRAVVLCNKGALSGGVALECFVRHAENSKELVLLAFLGGRYVELESQKTIK